MVFAPAWPALADPPQQCDPITVDQALKLAAQMGEANEAGDEVIPCIAFENGTVPPQIQALLDRVEQMQWQMKQPSMASQDFDWTAHYRRALERQRRVMQQIVIRIEMELEASAKDCEKRLAAEAALAKYYSGPLREYHTAYAVYHRSDPGGFDSLRDLHVTGRTPEIAQVMRRLSGEWMGILDPLALAQAEPVLRFNPLMEQKAETEAYAQAASYEPNYLKALSLRLVTTELSNWAALDALRDDGGGRIPCLPRELRDRHISLRDPNRIIEHDRWLRTETGFRRTLPAEAEKALAEAPIFVTPEVIDQLKPHVPYWRNFPSDQIATEIAKHEKVLAPQVFRELIQASSVPLSGLSPQARSERLAALASEARATVTLRYIDYVFQAWKAENPVEARQERLASIMPQLESYGGRLVPLLASMPGPQPFEAGRDRDAYVSALVPVAIAAAKIKEQQEMVEAGLPMPATQTITPSMAFVLQGKQLSKDFTILEDLTEDDEDDWHHGKYGRGKAQALVDILTSQKPFPEMKAAWQELVNGTSNGTVKRQLLAIGQRVGLDGDGFPSLARVLLDPEDRSKLYEQQFNMTTDALPMVSQWVRWTETTLGLDWLNPDTETRLYTILKQISEDRKPIYDARRGRLVVNRETIAEYVTPGLVDQTVREMQEVVDAKLDEMFRKHLWRPIVGHQLTLDPNSTTAKVLQGAQNDGRDLFYALGGRIIVNRSAVSRYAQPAEADAVAAGLQQIADATVENLPVYLAPRGNLNLTPTMQLTHLLDPQQFRDGESIKLDGDNLVVQSPLAYLMANRTQLETVEPSEQTVEQVMALLRTHPDGQQIIDSGQLHILPDNGQFPVRTQIGRQGQDARLAETIAYLQRRALRKPDDEFRTIRLGSNDPMAELVRGFGTSQRPLIVQPEDGRLIVDTGEMLRQMTDRPVFLGDRDALPHLAMEEHTKYVTMTPQHHFMYGLMPGTRRHVPWEVERGTLFSDPNTMFHRQTYTPPTAFVYDGKPYVMPGSDRDRFSLWNNQPTRFDPMQIFTPRRFQHFPVTTYRPGGGLQLADQPIRVGPPIYTFEDLVNARGAAYDQLDRQRALEIPRANSRRESSEDRRHVRRGGYPNIDPYSGYGSFEIPQYMIRQQEIRNAILQNDTDKLQERLDAYWHDINASWGNSAERRLAELLEDLEYWAGKGGDELTEDRFNRLAKRVDDMRRNWPDMVERMATGLDRQLKYLDDLRDKDSLASGFLGLSSTPIRSGPKRVIRRFTEERRAELPERRTQLIQQGQPILDQLDEIMEQLSGKPNYSSLNEAMMTELPMSRIGETRAALCREIDQRCVSSGLSFAQEGVIDADAALQEDTPDLAAMHKDVQQQLSEGAILSAVHEAISDICKTLANTAEMDSVEDMRKLLLAAEIRRALLQEQPVFVDIDKASEKELLEALHGGWKGKVALIIGAGFLILLIPGVGGAIVAVIGATAFHATIATALVVSAGITIDNIQELHSRKDFVIDLGTATHEGRRITNDAIIAAIDDQLYGLRWDLDESWLPHIGEYWALGMDAAFIGLEGFTAVKAFRLHRAARLAGATEKVEMIMRDASLLERAGLAGKKIDDLTPDELTQLFNAWAESTHPGALARLQETGVPHRRFRDIFKDFGDNFRITYAAIETLKTAKKGSDVARTQTLLREIVEELKPQLLRGRTVDQLTPDEWDDVYRLFAQKYHPDVAGRGITPAQQESLLARYADDIASNAAKEPIAVAYEEHFKAGAEAFSFVEKSGGWAKFWRMDPAYVPPHALAPDPKLKQWWDYWRERAFGGPAKPVGDTGPVALLPPPPGWMPPE